ncbi:MAG: hypothetical protein CVU05_14900 [Bacteroidetes bacterium HGW-Bacteroidetes-21]|jgi:hypothetical protein|nr:MAG: hypothetical protein CVU05_14900 [Bacteroidetes bacterium HGW-Bacteroidetes-21]
MNTQFSFYDETYNPDSFDNYSLRFYLSDDFVAWCIIDLIRNKFVSFRYLTLPSQNWADKLNYLNEILATEHLEKNKFRKCQVLYNTAASILIPASVEGTETNRDILEFTCKGLSLRDKIHSSQITDTISNIFAVPEDLTRFFEKLGDYAIMHPYTPLIQQLKVIAGKGTAITTEMFSGGMLLAAMKNEDLVFCNSFRCEAPSDFAYHVAGVYKSLGFDLNEVPLHVTGITEVKDERITQITRFVRKVVMRSPSPELLFSYRFNEIPKHWFTLMFDM